MRDVFELKNVIKALELQRQRLPEFDYKGRNTWKIIEEELYYTQYLLEYGYIPRYKNNEVDATDCYIWLKGDDNWSSYYDDMMLELINHGS